MNKKNVWKIVHSIANLLLIVGGLAWGSVGIWGYYFVSDAVTRAGAPSILTSIVYVLVGAAAIVDLVCLIKHWTE